MKLSNEELTGKVLHPETLRLAVEQVKINGYVILESVFPKENVAHLHSTFMNIFNAHLEKNSFNRGANRAQMHLPFVQPFIDPDIITSPFALPVIEALLGEDCTCRYFASDTPLPGSEYQGVHADTRPLFPEAQLPLPVYGLALNIPLVDFRADNGPLEIWPGGTHYTHLKADSNNRNPIIQEIAPYMHFQPVLMPAGSLLIRDARMWHRGTPNRSDAARPNLALVYFRSWYNTSPRIAIPQETYDGLSERAKRLLRMEDIGVNIR